MLGVSGPSGSLPLVIMWCCGAFNTHDEDLPPRSLSLSLSHSLAPVSTLGLCVV